MIHGIGVDIVKVERMRAGLQRFGHRFSRRILTPQEHVEFESRRCPPRFLASRFAAKEAYSKALGSGFRDGLTFHTLSVSNDPLGRPLMICAGRAAEIIEALDIGSIHLSLSDEIDFAVGFVVLECAARPHRSFEPFAPAHLVSTLAAAAEIPASTSEKPIATAFPE